MLMKKDGMYCNKLGQMLSTDLQVMAMVYDYNIQDKPIWFSKLIELFKGNLSSSEISKAQDRLYDLGLLNTKYENVDGMWTCCWHIEDEGKSFINNIIGEG